MCGIVGMVPLAAGQAAEAPPDLNRIGNLVETVSQQGCRACLKESDFAVDRYLAGQDLMETLKAEVGRLKTDAAFGTLLSREADIQTLTGIADRLQQFVTAERQDLDANLGLINSRAVTLAVERLDLLRDIDWCLRQETLENLTKIKDMGPAPVFSQESVALLKKLNATLNSLDRLEVRGRDSAGISIMVTLDTAIFDVFQNILFQEGLWEEFTARSNPAVLVNNALCFYQKNEEQTVSLTFVYKFAAEIGRLGDNIAFLRKQIRRDTIFQALLNLSCEVFTIAAHTRWASVGTISEANCHPVDNHLSGTEGVHGHVMHVSLNGDIDNFQELKEAHEAAGETFDERITTDTKIIPVRVQFYLAQGNSLEDAFQLALNDFKGAHAICLQTDLAPGKLFFAQKGSGQALFIGLAGEHYVVASELYGVVEETSCFIKMNANHNGQDGQIVCLDRRARGLEGIRAWHYDGTPVVLDESQLQYTEITARDVDRQDFPHYFLKEISEAPRSIERTLQNRWKVDEAEADTYRVALDETIVTPDLAEALRRGAIRRIFFVGQGTAGVAAQAAAEIMNYYLADPALLVTSLKSSELSGFKLQESADTNHRMADTLVVAISQSGTTTDTNRALDMVSQRGAHTLAIVNRRDSDITFKVDGVFYTSTGRDIEMSVASTKAFYSQVVAGALLSLYVAALQGARSAAFVTGEIKQMLRLPGLLEQIFANRAVIKTSARKLAAAKIYWATVGSGPNKASADEIRIKLSELCYKTISSDFVEDKKHIDLSAEPLIIVCAAGARAGVLDDLVKDTAIFRAHKAAPVVIADEAEERFHPYAVDVLPVPVAAEHFGPILNTYAGHLWGYYAALAINDGSRLLADFRGSLQREIEQYLHQGLDRFEIVLENDFREKIMRFYEEFRRKRRDPDFPAAIAQASDLTLLFKYLAGRLPLSDFESDFGKKGTAPNLLETIFYYLGESINQMARPVDAIKHQAKTVTVGTSRTTETLTGVLFEAMTAHGLNLNQLTNNNIVVLKNVQEVVDGVEGAILYEINGLNMLGSPTNDSVIKVMTKSGVLGQIPSRVETDSRLKGTKKIIVREGNVYIGQGRKDNRQIVVIPVLSATPSQGGQIRNLLLLNIRLKTASTLFARKKALGGKFERIKNYVQENSLLWQDKYLDLVDLPDLFGKSAEKIAEAIIAAVEP